MSILLQSEFLQFKLLSADDFSNFLMARGINLRLEDLEYYDKKDIIRPALRLNRPKIDQTWQKYSPIQSDSFSMKYYYKEGLIEFPIEGDFKPWKSYIDNHEKAVELYYHPHQIISLKDLTMGNNVTLKPQYFEVVHDFQKYLEKEKERVEVLLELKQVQSKNWLPKIGLLMLLQEAYGFYVDSLIGDPHTDHNLFLEKWKRWRLNKFQPENLRNISGMSIDEIKQCYKELVSIGHIMDPLSNWFVLLQLVNRAKINKLKKEALLAQDYYKLAKMVAFFIYDLTKEKMPDPDDMIDSNGGNWKPLVYGRPFDYGSKQTRVKILDNYLIDGPLRIALVYEGLTEETIIKIIFNALNVDENRDGIFLWNASGQGNIKENLFGLVKLAREEAIEVFLILDHDADWLIILEDFKRRGYLKEGMYHVWNRDFELDNFRLEEILNKINSILNEKSLQPLEKDEVMQKGDVSFKVISDLVKEKNSIKLDDVLSKKDLAQMLVEPRIAQIKQERCGNGWKPLLPIEKILYKIFDMVTKVIG